jgi:hypothetical protein
MVDTNNDAIIDKYFQLVQEEIKKLISEDKEIKPNQVEMFNNEIFNQPAEIQDQIRRYVGDAAEGNLDIKKIAKELYDKFKVQVKNNVFNQNDAQNVPNKLVGEKTLNFEEFILNEEFKLKYNEQNFRELLRQFNDKVMEASEILGQLPYKYYNKNYLVIGIQDIANILKTENPELGEEIVKLAGEIDDFRIKSEIEISQLN